MWLLGATVALSGLVAYGVWSVRATAADLNAARGDAQRLQTAMSAEDDGRVAHSPGRAWSRTSRLLAARTDGPLWGLASHLPFVGGDVRAVQVVAAVGDDLTKGTLAELVDEAGSDVRDRLAPHDGRIDIAAVEEVAPLVGRADRNLNAAAGACARSIQTHSRNGCSPLTRSSAAWSSTASTGLAAANRAVQVLPTMLGKDGPRRYLLMFENNAEIRATGGLARRLRTRHGRQRQDHSDQAGCSEVTSASSRSRCCRSPRPRRRSISDQIAEYFQDTNFTPEFPRTAELVREMWKRSKGQTLDGVMSVDVVSLSYLLRATGPVEAPGGVRLTAKNATEELLNKVYFRLPDTKKQDDFLPGRRQADLRAGQRGRRLDDDVLDRPGAGRDGGTDLRP